MANFDSESLSKAIDDAKILFNLSEAEIFCMTQLIMMIKMLGYSLELTLKLLKAVAMVLETQMDVDKTRK